MRVFSKSDSENPFGVSAVQVKYRWNFPFGTLIVRLEYQSDFAFGHCGQADGVLGVAP